LFGYANRSGDTYTLPSGIKNLEDGAFFDCNALTQLVLPANLRSVGWYVFENCTALKSLSFPAGVAAISRRAFYGCSAMESIAVDSANPYYYSDGRALIYKKTSELTVCIKGLETSYVTPATTKLIGSHSFETCYGLEHVTLSEGITLIDTEGFWECKTLQSAVLPSTLERINTLAFYGCVALTTIFIPISVDVIQSKAFVYCTSLHILCEAASKPANWDSAWNASNCPVTWGATRP
jgi:hypothetical protein